MNTVWVVVAGASEARIYASSTPHWELKEIAHLEHPDSRKHARDITSDLPGRNVGSDGSHHAMDEETDIKQAEAVEFSRQIDDYLRSGLNSHQYGKLVIIATPAFLGHLRAHMDTQVARTVAYELGKNLLRSDAAGIRAHLPAQL